MTTRGLSFILFLCFFCMTATGTEYSNIPLAKYGPVDEAALRSKLLEGYDPMSRPYSPCGVLLDTILLSLNRLSIEDQEMSVTTVINVMWYDERLRWAPGNHVNQSEIVLDFGTVWQPRLVVENSIGRISVLGDNVRPPVRVHWSGYVLMTIPTVLEIFCETKILKFPFDSQECTARLYAWGYYTDEIYVVQNATSQEDMFRFFSPNGEWEPQGCTMQTEMLKVDSVSSIQKLKISFHFRRKWVFLSLTLIVLAVLNSMLMSAVFALPFESGEKMSYSLTVLLTFIVLLTLVADSLPPISTEISALQMFLTGVMCVGTVATLLTVWTVTMYNRPAHAHKPRWLIFLCTRVLRPLVCSKAKDSAHPKSPVGTNTPKSGHINPYPTSYGSDALSNKLKDLYVDVISAAGFTGGAAGFGTQSAPQNGSLINFDHPDDGSVMSGFRGSATGHNYTTGPAGKHLAEDSRAAIGLWSDDPNRVTGVDGWRGEPNDLTWQEVALLVDAVCLRAVSFVIFTGTVALFVFYAVSY